MLCASDLVCSEVKPFRLYVPPSAQAKTVPPLTVTCRREGPIPANTKAQSSHTLLVRAYVTNSGRAEPIVDINDV
jgi:hypothetical protein